LKIHFKSLAIMSVMAIGISVSSDGMAAQMLMMEDAIRSLQETKTFLQQALKDKGGHRMQAIQAVDQAIAEVKAGVEFDRTHLSGKEKDKEEAKSNPGIQSDAQNINTACSIEAKTAGCTGEIVGKGLMRCLYNYRMANKTFNFSDGCMAAIKQHHADKMMR